MNKNWFAIKIVGNNADYVAGLIGGIVASIAGHLPNRSFPEGMTAVKKDKTANVESMLTVETTWELFDKIIETVELHCPDVCVYTVM